MARALFLSLAFTVFLLIGLVSARDWNILNSFRGGGQSNANRKIRVNDSESLGTSHLKKYCQSWRTNVELHNIRDFQVVPQECIDFIGKYMKSSQYKADVESAVDSVIIYLSDSCCDRRTCDGNDAWIFDVDYTVISTIPYYKKHGFGGEKQNETCLEQWMEERQAPGVAHMVRLYHEIRERGIKIFLVSARKEMLRSATIDNLLQEGYHSWTSLILRDVADEVKQVRDFKAEVRQRLESKRVHDMGRHG